MYIKITRLISSLGLICGSINLIFVIFGFLTGTWFMCSVNIVGTLGGFYSTYMGIILTERYKVRY